MEISKTILEELSRYNQINNYIVEQAVEPPVEAPGEVPPPPAGAPGETPPPPTGETPPAEGDEPTPVDASLAPTSTPRALARIWNSSSEIKPSA